ATSAGTAPPGDGRASTTRGVAVVGAGAAGASATGGVAAAGAGAAGASATGGVAAAGAGAAGAGAAAAATVTGAVSGTVMLRPACSRAPVRRWFSRASVSAETPKRTATPVS